jgi:hypothetical protein
MQARCWCPSPVVGYFKLEPLTPSAMIINSPDLITTVSKLAALFSAPKSLTQLQQMGLVSWLSTARHWALPKYTPVLSPDYNILITSASGIAVGSV